MPPLSDVKLIFEVSGPDLLKFRRPNFFNFKCIIKTVS